jgi:hypothetical protein
MKPVQRMLSVDYFAYYAYFEANEVLIIARYTEVSKKNYA